MANVGGLEIVLLLLLWLVAGGIPAYVVCERLNVSYPGLAFIPGVGPTIAILRSIKTSAWATLLGVIPIVSIFFYVWLAFTVPSRHGRFSAWGIWFIVPLANVVGFFVYAFTLAPKSANVQELKTCPDCAETIHAAAKVCRFCGHRFEESPGSETPEDEPVAEEALDVTGRIMATESPTEQSRPAALVDEVPAQPPEPRNEIERQAARSWRKR